MKALIIYGSTHGQVKKICEFIRDEILRTGHIAKVIEASKPVPDINMYDMYIIGASVHIGNYQKSVRNFVKRNNKILKEKPSAFVSVSLTAAGNDEAAHADMEKITANFLTKYDWRPQNIIQTAGALMYSKYNFIIKFIMKRIARQNNADTDTSQDYEYTDWTELKDFTRSLLAQAEPVSA